MWYLYILVPIIIIIICYGYFVYKKKEGFQIDDISGSFDISGVLNDVIQNKDLSGIAVELKKLNLDLSGNKAAPDNKDRQCEVYAQQISAFNKAIEGYKSHAGWLSVRTTNGMILNLQDKLVELKC